MDVPLLVVGTRPAWADSAAPDPDAWGPFAVDQADASFVGILLRITPHAVSWFDADREHVVAYTRLDATPTALVGRDTLGRSLTIRPLDGTDRAWLVPTVPRGVDVVRHCRAAWRWDEA